MANDDHIAQLKKGVAAWNAWREENPDIRPDLDGANLRGLNLMSANLKGANIQGADLTTAILCWAKLCTANLSGANLSGALLTEADLTDADLTGCRVYGASAWDLKLDGAKRHNLVITPASESAVVVDDLEVAQFIYLLLHREKIRNRHQHSHSKGCGSFRSVWRGRTPDFAGGSCVAPHDEARRIAANIAKLPPAIEQSAHRANAQSGQCRVARH